MIRKKYYLKRGNGFGVGSAVEGEGRGKLLGKEDLMGAVGRRRGKGRRKVRKGWVVICKRKGNNE